MNQTLVFLGLLSVFVFGVNACGRPCVDDSQCADINPDINLCCNSCCPGTLDCSTPNICGLCKDDCVPSLGPCPLNIAPVCCDGKDFGNQCFASNACAKNCKEGSCLVACPRDVKRCPDGSYVAREGSHCEFAPCVGDTCYDCSTDLLCACGICPDGINQFGCCGTCQYKKNINGDVDCSGIISCPKCVPSKRLCADVYAPVCCNGKQFSNQCFALTECATNCVKGECPVICTKDAKICPDESFVGRVAPDCEFAECPECGKNKCVDAMGHCVDGGIVNCKVSPCLINNGGCKPRQLCIENYCNGCNAVCEKINRKTACDLGLNGYCIDGRGNCVKDEIVNCYIDPCLINNGGCSSHEQCTVNYCGGCNAVCTQY